MREVNEIVSLKEISSIDIKVREGNIKLVDTDYDYLHITGFLGSLCKEISMEKNGDTFTIKQKCRNFQLVKLSSTTLTIGIPKRHKLNINIKQDTGYLLVKGIKSSVLDMKLKAAKVVIDDIIFDELLINGGTRNIKVDLKNNSGNINIKSLVGKIDLSLAKVNGNINIKGGTMGGKITIPKNAPLLINVNNKDANFKRILDNQYYLNIKSKVNTIKVNTN